jgi:hypothetical protein
MGKCTMQDAKCEMQKGGNSPGVGGMRGLVGYPTTSFKLQSFGRMFDGLL